MLDRSLAVNLQQVVKLRIVFTVYWIVVVVMVDIINVNRRVSLQIGDMLNDLVWNVSLALRV